MNPRYPRAIPASASKQDVDVDMIFSGLGYFLPIFQEPPESDTGRQVLVQLFRDSVASDNRDDYAEDSEYQEVAEVSAFGR